MSAGQEPGSFSSTYKIVGFGSLCYYNSWLVGRARRRRDAVVLLIDM